MIRKRGSRSAALAVAAMAIVPLVGPARASSREEAWLTAIMQRADGSGECFGVFG